VVGAVIGGNVVTLVTIVLITTVDVLFSYGGVNVVAVVSETVTPVPVDMLVMTVELLT
jgi:hypothetical protein